MHSSRCRCSYEESVGGVEKGRELESGIEDSVTSFVAEFMSTEKASYLIRKISWFQNIISKHSILIDTTVACSNICRDRAGLHISLSSSK